MKKTTFILTMVMVLSLTACGNGGKSASEPETTESDEIQVISVEELENPGDEETEASTETSENPSDAETEASTETSATPNNTETETADETKSPVESVQHPEVPSAYAELLDQYAAALNEKWDGGILIEKGMSLVMLDCYGDTPTENIGYAIMDLNGDGSKELLIGTTDNITDDFYGKLVFDLYTLDNNNTAVLIFSSSARDRYYYVGENKFANLGSGGAADSFETTVKFEGGEMIDMTQTTDPGSYVQLELTPISGW